MLRRALAILFAFCLCAPAVALEAVTVATTRDASNGALFLAAARGYFKAEGIDLAMRAYPSAQAAAEALAGNAADLGLTAFTATAFDLAGRGAIKAIAGQASEKNGYEGNAVVASATAHVRGLRHFENLANKSVALLELGGQFHYQLGQIAARKQFGLGTITMRQLPSVDEIVKAVADNKLDAAILPGIYARQMLLAGQARHVGWYSELDEQQLGALFASAKTLQTRRATIEKFLRAYRRGIADYTVAFLRQDAYHKRILDDRTQKAAVQIARYLYPGRSVEGASRAVIDATYYMPAQARLDPADIARQVAWYKAQGLIGRDVDAAVVADVSFNPPPPPPSPLSRH
jgi:NitT/TauT family transport system substrate-binding protein